MDHNISLQFSSSLENIQDINESFSSAQLRVCYTGRNRNKSNISKDSIIDAIPSMFNCPIVCNYDVEADTIGGHDMACVRTDSGALRLINLTDAIGVVPSEAKYHFETVVEKDGSEHEYFVTEAILWKRSPAYSKIVTDGIESQSMEITVKRGRMLDDGFFDIEKFIFTAFCILGEDVEPCFESASIQMFNYGNCREQFTKMMEDFKKVTTSVGVDIHPQILMKGGEEQLEQKMELITKFGFTVEELGFDIETMSYEELEMALTKKQKEADDDDEEIVDEVPGDETGEETEPEAEEDPVEEQADEPADESVDETTDEQEEHSEDEGGEESFALAGQLVDAIYEALSGITYTDEWGTWSKYWYYDHDAELFEIYVHDSEDYRLYGFKYSMNGDKVEIDFNSKKRKKFSIVDFNEGDAEFAFKLLEDTAGKLSESRQKFAELEEKYNAASSTIAELTKEVESLRQYQATKQAEERSAEVESVFEQFEDLTGEEAFEQLRAENADMTIEQIEEKCFAIRGRKTTKTFSVVKPKATRVPIERTSSAADDEPYGGLFNEFKPFEN